MIINEMTLSIKNILFFKAVCITIAVICLTYTINELSTEVTQSNDNYSKASIIYSGALERFNAINKQSENLDEAMAKYQTLKKIATSHIDDDCFNKEAYETSILNASKTNGIKDNPAVFISSGLGSRINPQNESILLKVTNVKLQYHIDCFLASIEFAKSAYNSLPKYSIVRNIEILKHSSLTPDIVSWLETANEPDLIATTINMEVRELTLNDQ